MTWATLDPAVQRIAQKALTEKQLAITQARLDGHSWRTIALAHKIDEATARGHWNRALKRLEPHYREIRKAAA